ncbi:putative 3-demethylubiquinone-9 3-methyltransferase [Lojkania enalia]|uniref:3-demethylubiquinone-9 3-methyltransferase n=1 Tax=Lojkania enalia TaxID=147567 RepID=A0A9P4KE19_9PLEO|nr:putative 3-demethylubiquinone-9 3-methyltransferase [Didymosphaeria enalia]
MASTTIAAPFFMFQDGKAEEALNYYIKIIPNSNIQSITRYGAGEHGQEGSIKVAHATVGGLHIMAIDSPIQHQFNFTPSLSLYITLPDEETITEVSKQLADGGMERMPLGEYGFSKKYAWVEDRFGVSWQLNLD